LHSRVRGSYPIRQKEEEEALGTNHLLHLEKERFCWRKKKKEKIKKTKKKTRENGREKI